MFNPNINAILSSPYKVSLIKKMTRKTQKHNKAIKSLIKMPYHNLRYKVKKAIALSLSFNESQLDPIPSAVGKEGHIVCNGALNTFLSWLYCRYKGDDHKIINSKYTTAL